MPKDQKPPTPPATIPATQYLFPEHEGKGEGDNKNKGDDKVPAEGKPPKKRGGGIRAVRGLLPELYPDGVPDHVSTETVRQQTRVKLGRLFGWNTVNRALCRGE